MILRDFINFVCLLRNSTDFKGFNIFKNISKGSKVCQKISKDFWSFLEIPCNFKDVKGVCKDGCCWKFIYTELWVIWKNSLFVVCPLSTSICPIFLYSLLQYGLFYNSFLHNYFLNEFSIIAKKLFWKFIIRKRLCFYTGFPICNIFYNGPIFKRVIISRSLLK